MSSSSRCRHRVPTTARPAHAGTGPVRASTGRGTAGPPLSYPAPHVGVPARPAPVDPC